jgi:hypothetical protein
MGVLGVPALLAQEAARDVPSTEDVMNLFLAMHVREQTLAVMQKSEEQIKTLTRDLVERRIPKITPAQLGELDIMIGDLYENYPVDRILNDMVPVYQRHLTRQDIKSTLAFYSSPVGQKLMQEMPAMTAEAMQVAAARLEEDNDAIMRRLEEKIRKMAEEQKQRNPKPETPSTPK